MCKSEPQIAVEVTRRITSSGFSSFGIGDVIDGDFAGMMEDECFHMSGRRNLG